jgi:microcystin-dependent protein
VADGRLLSIIVQPDLFAVLGTTYGGDGVTTFVLPDLRGRAVVQAGCSAFGCRAPGEQFGSESVAITQAPRPTRLSSRSLERPSGDGRTTFGLPNLRGRTAVGAGTGPGLDTVGYGSQYGSASLALWALPSVWPDPTVPAPTGVTGSAQTGSARVTWVAPTSNGGSPITGYVITPYLGTVALTPRRYVTVALEQVVSDLERGKSYTFKVAATNAAGTGLDSLASKAVAPK